MKTLPVCIILFVAADAGLSQHFEWTVTRVNGPELSEVHPDSILNDSLAVSTERGVVSWLPMDSITSMTYAHNPTLLTMSAIGGMIGGTAGSNGGSDDRKGVTIAIGVLSGVALGYFIGDLLGVRDEIHVATLGPEERNRIIAQRVARWSGRLKIIQ